METGDRIKRSCVMIAAHCRAFGVVLKCNHGRRAAVLTGQKRFLSEEVTPSSREKRPADPAVVKPEVEASAHMKVEKKDFDFDVEVRKVLRQINDAAVPMVGNNPKFSVEFTVSEPSLTILTGRGSLYFTVDKHHGLLDLQSFLSGAQQYYFDTEEGEWLSKNDKHNLRGGVTRDLIRHSRGRPDLDDKA